VILTILAISGSESCLALLIIRSATSGLIGRNACPYTCMNVGASCSACCGLKLRYEKVSAISSCRLSLYATDLGSKEAHKSGLALLLIAVASSRIADRVVSGIRPASSITSKITWPSSCLAVCARAARGRVVKSFLFIRIDLSCPSPVATLRIAP